MRTLHRLKLMSSPSLSELGKSEKSSPEDRGEKQKRAGANATWNRYTSEHERAEGVFRTVILSSVYVLLLLQHPQCCHSRLPEKGFGR